MPSAPSPATPAGTGPEQGPVIVAFFGHQAMGNYLMCNYTAAAVARSLPNSKLVAIYREDRPYKPVINQLNPYLDQALPLPDKNDAAFPMDWLDPDENGGETPFTQWLANAGIGRPDLFLTSSMIGSQETSFLLPPPTFRIPDDWAEPCTKTLVKLGLDPNRWFACLHVREGNYIFRKTPTSNDSSDSVEMRYARRVRDTHPMSYLPAVIDIIEKQGGQVVRVGDPSMTPYPKINGLVDLSQIHDSLITQLFAISRARYFMGTPSGPVTFSCALKVPSVLTNALSIGVWNPGDAILLKKVTMPDGKELSHEELALIAGELPAWYAGIQYENNSEQQLVDAARHMFDATAGIEGWRGRAPDDLPAPTSGTIPLPPDRRPFGDIEGLVWL